jgi:hypothetical protein
MENEPKLYKPAEMSEINKERILSDAELITDGADITPEGRIIPTDEQMESMEEEFRDSEQERESELFYEKLDLESIKKYGVKKVIRQTALERQKYVYGSTALREEGDEVPYFIIIINANKSYQLMVKQDGNVMGYSKAKYYENPVGIKGDVGKKIYDSLMECKEDELTTEFSKIIEDLI